MSSTLVDANVLLDVTDDEGEWHDWSADALAECARSSRLVINPLIFAEVSIGFADLESLDAALPPDIEREPLPWDAAFLAGRAFLVYKREGGIRRSPLPDFYIGAHAAVADYTLLTRDARRYRYYFPKLRIVAP